MIRAVIADTWRQSRQQVVFIVMLAVMLLALVAGIALPRAIETADGQKRFGTILSDQPADFLAQQWTNEYARTLLPGDDASRAVAQREIFSDSTLSQAQRSENLRALVQEQQRARNEAVAKATSVPEYQRAVEYYVYQVVGLMFRVTMLLFIAACAGYFPAMLASGAVDIVLSKPVSRARIYFGKYLGGIALYTAALTAFCLLMFVGIGLRTGVFPQRIFFAIPLLVFTAMVLYAVLALVGTLGRSATMAMVTGYVFYVVVDSLVGLLLQNQLLFERMGWDSVAGFTDMLRHVLPNFGVMNRMALASLLNMPAFQATPFVVAFAWLVGCLGLGYWVFQRRDY